MSKVISFDLSVSWIDKAIQELNQFRNELTRKCNELIQQLTEYGKVFAKMEVLRLGAFDTGQLADKIQGFFDASSRVGFIRADCWYAVYVEYGTGVVGASESHPEPAAGWIYDVNNHGQSGWVYFNEREGKVMRTKGQPSSPFMYNTFRELQRKANDYASTVFGK